MYTFTQHSYNKFIDSKDVLFLRVKFILELRIENNSLPNATFHWEHLWQWSKQAYNIQGNFMSKFYFNSDRQSLIPNQWSNHLKLEAQNHLLGEPNFSFLMIQKFNVNQAKQEKYLGLKIVCRLEKNIIDLNTREKVLMKVKLRMKKIPPMLTFSMLTAIYLYLYELNGYSLVLDAVSASL